MPLNGSKTSCSGLGFLEMSCRKKRKPLSTLDLKINLLVATDLREGLDKEMGKLVERVVRVLKEI